MNADNFFNPEERKKIVTAIEQAELNTSGEIRVHIENHCKCDALDRAVQVFSKLKMNKTQSRNGVLLYLAIKDKQFAIIGDAGVNAKVESNFWDNTKSIMLNEFKSGNFCDGLVKGIGSAGEQLQVFFPYQSDDINELSDDISFGEN